MGVPLGWEEVASSRRGWTSPWPSPGLSLQLALPCPRTGSAPPGPLIYKPYVLCPCLPCCLSKASAASPDNRRTRGPGKWGGARGKRSSGVLRYAPPLLRNPHTRTHTHTPWTPQGPVRRTCLKIGSCPCLKAEFLLFPPGATPLTPLGEGIPEGELTSVPSLTGQGSWTFPYLRHAAFSSSQCGDEGRTWPDGRLDSSRPSPAERVA